MSTQLNEDARCVIAFDTFEVEQLENTGMAVPTPGIPFQVNITEEDSWGRCQTFSTKRERRYFYEIDYRKAESAGACVFYYSCNEGIRVYTIPSRYLKLSLIHIFIVPLFKGTLVTPLSQGYLFASY